MFCVILLCSRYTFIHFYHIWTNLLTQCTPVPVPVFCYFSISVFPHIKSARKIPGKIQEKSAYRKLREEPERGQRGARGPRRPPGVAPPLAWPGGRRGPLVHLLLPPLRLFILRHGETPKTEPYFANSPLFRRRRASEIRSTRRPLPGTLPEGGLTSGSLLSTMDAPRMSCE